jgi:type IV secretory pathway protease TraF
MKRLLALSPLVVAYVALMTPHAQPVIIYNPSQSVPSGFYLRSGHPPGRGDFVTVAAFEVAPQYAALRGYADRTDRFLKRVAATEGQLVCAEGEMISTAPKSPRGSSAMRQDARCLLGAVAAGSMSASCFCLATQMIPLMAAIGGRS